MRNFIYTIFTVLSLSLSCFAEDNFSTTVGTDSITISPPSKELPTEVSVGDTVASGDIITFDSVTAYMALESGDVTVAPTGQVETVASPVLRKCRMVRGLLEHRKFVIFEAISGSIWWTLGDGEAEVGKGIQLKEGERMWINDPSALKCISTDSAVIGTQEIF